MKHALPDIREDLPATEWPLSTAGRERCPVLADELGRFAPTSVTASREPKAAETGELIAGALELPFRTAPHLHEHDRCGVPFLAPQEFHDSVRQLFARPDQVVFGRESARAAGERFRHAVDAVLASSPEESPIMVAHGTVISLYVGECTGTDPYELWRALGLPSYLVLSIPDMTLEEVAARVPSR